MWIRIALVGLLGSLAILWLWNAQPDSPDSPPPTPSPSPNASSKSITTNSTPAPRSNSDDLTELSEQGPRQPQAAEQVFQSDAEAMQQSVKGVLGHMKHALRFPADSQPLMPDQWQLLEPNKPHPTKYPLVMGSDSFVALDPGQFRYMHHENIEVSVSIQFEKNRPPKKVSHVMAFVENKKQIYASITLTADPTNTSEFLRFHGQFESSGQDSWPSELYLRAEVHWEASAESPFMLGTQVSWVPSVAALVESQGVHAYVEGAHLSIPLKWDVQMAGDYKISANLLDLQTQQPIAHLIARGGVGVGIHVFTFQAHASTLKYRQAAGPYELKITQVERLPSQLGGERHYGHVPSQAFKVSSFPLDSYDNTPYVDPRRLKKQQKLEKWFSK